MWPTASPIRPQRSQSGTRARWYVPAELAPAPALLGMRCALLGDSVATPRAPALLARNFHSHGILQVVDGKVVLLCIRNYQDLLRLRSADAAGLVWPKPHSAEDITLDTFASSNTEMRCGPGALAAGGDMRQANLTAAAARKWCLATPRCGGFTTKSGSANTTCSAGVSEPVLEVFFKSRVSGWNSDRTWTSWAKHYPPGTNVATGPPGGVVLQPSGRIVAEYYRMAGPAGTTAGTLLSDDGGVHFRPSVGGVPGGGEGTVAVAPNGSLIMNTRASQNIRFQSASDDGGDHWSTPRPLLGFGSNAEGSMIRMHPPHDPHGTGTVGEDGGLMLLSHAGNVNGTAGRWNMTIWSSTDSAATWIPAVQVEPDADVRQLRHHFGPFPTQL